MALSASGNELYRLDRESLTVVDRSSGQASLAPLPANFPPFSWPTDLALDTTRQIVTVATLGGEGFLYRYDVASRRWLDFRSLKDIDVISLSHDADARRHVAWTSDGDPLLISDDGSVDVRKQLAARLASFGDTYDRGNAQVPRVQLIPHGNVVALVRFNGAQVARIWRYDVATDTAQLTWRAAR